METVSVIVTCYNKGKYIRETLDSIRSQTYPNIEIIVIDDCSTDPFTIKTMQSLSETGIKTLLLSENIGVSAARNLGIRSCTGSYILIMDGDDTITPDFIDEAVQVFSERPEIGIVSSQVRLFGLKKGKMNLLEPTLENTIAQNTMVISSIFRKELFQRTGGFNTDMKEGFEDWDFWLSMMEHDVRIHTLPKAHFNYRITANSRNHLSENELKTLRRRIYDNHRKLYAENFMDPRLTFEYQLLKNSREYRIGSIVMGILKKLRIA
jgi:glycosyltransferase involved in cell wall biosynthesis